MTTAADLLNVANSQLGVVEGPGPNEVLYNDWFYRRHIVGAQYAWCEVFVSWCAEQVDAQLIIPKSASTVAAAAWYRARGLWGLVPRPGAQSFYEWPGMGRISHTGVVESVLPDGSIIALEGNTDVTGGRTGGRVMRQHRRAYIAGYGYPAYDNVVAPPVLVPPVAVGHATLRLGSRGPAVQQLQQKLGVPDDGEFGPITLRAVKAFQATHGLQQDGVVGSITWGVLDGTSAPAPAPAPPAPAPRMTGPTLAFGAKGDDVVRLQQHLGIPADGVFGKQTRAAVLAFQAAHGLKQDAVVGPKTWGALG